MNDCMTVFPINFSQSIFPIIIFSKKKIPNRILPYLIYPNVISPPPKKKNHNILFYILIILIPI